MLALGIRYLTRYAVATNLARQRPEWPPHPGRVFMAMAAAHFETGADPQERLALEWLESARPPAMCASEADERITVRTYVPVNDVHGGIVRRPRLDRAFPRSRPHDDRVFLIWPGDASEDIRKTLDDVCRKVTRIGHSMSAVQMWVVPNGEEPQPNLLPGDGQLQTSLRVPSRGTMRSLEASFNGAAIEEYERLSNALATAKGAQKRRLKCDVEEKFPEGRPDSRRPQILQWQSYGRPRSSLDIPAADLGPFDDTFIILRKEDGPALGLESTLQLTAALRNAAMQARGVDVAPPEWLTGHDASGRPSRRVHVAFFPLPYVGYEHADGHVMGLGIAIPREFASSPELRSVLGPLFFDEHHEERDIQLWRKGAWRWQLRREDRERPPLSLQRLTWTRASRVWATVTPVVLHHYPKKREGNVERILREAFVSALLPEPELIDVRSVSRVPGAGHALAVPQYAEGGENLCRYQTHVLARFTTPVVGPILVGRGRFRGYGLFRPVSDEELDAWVK
jgi:CRISPR-associated protein Csb2